MSAESAKSGPPLQLSRSNAVLPLRLAIWVSSAYIVLCSAYIVVSSTELANRVTSVIELRNYEVLKGLLFVFVTGLVFFAFSWFLFRRIAKQQARIATQMHALLQAEQRTLASVFAAAVAHDISNMLTVAQGSLYILDDPSSGIEDRRLASREIRLAVGELLQLSRRLMQVDAKPQAIPQAFELCEALQDAVSFAKTHPHLRRCELVTELAGPVEVVGQRPAIRSLTLNLLLNAGEALGGQGRILLKGFRENQNACIEVHDSGPGVAPELRARVFEPFVTSKDTGTGLGLSSVLAIAREHQGTAIVDSSPVLGGALFRVEFPIVSAGKSTV
jgi:signal transduction histidine kinase